MADGEVGKRRAMAVEDVRKEGMEVAVKKKATADAEVVKIRLSAVTKEGVDMAAAMSDATRVADMEAILEETTIAQAVARADTEETSAATSRLATAVVRVARQATVEARMKNSAARKLIATIAGLVVGTVISPAVGMEAETISLAVAMEAEIISPQTALEEATRATAETQPRTLASNPQELPTAAHTAAPTTSAALLNTLSPALATQAIRTCSAWRLAC